MGRKSPTLEAKLNRHFRPDPIANDIDSLLNASLSPNRFNSPQDLKNYLTEGAMLNISTIGARALSVPCGDYTVWVTDAGHTMLVPANESKAPTEEVFEHAPQQYEVLTRDLLNNYNKLEKTLVEDFGQSEFEQPSSEQQSDQARENNEYDDGGAPSPIPNKIDASTVERHSIMRAMQDRGFTVTSLADEVGVDPPAISRILRTPKDTQGDPGGRNPSIGLASQICNALRIDPTVAFPDIFNPTSHDYKARQGEGNRGSGDQGHHGKGIVSSESVASEFMALTHDIAKAGWTAKEFWRNCFKPALNEAKSTNPLTFLRELRNWKEWVMVEDFENDLGQLNDRMSGGGQQTSQYGRKAPRQNTRANLFNTNNPGHNGFPINPTGPDDPDEQWGVESPADTSDPLAVSNKPPQQNYPTAAPMAQAKPVAPQPAAEEDPWAEADGYVGIDPEFDAAHRAALGNKPQPEFEMPTETPPAPEFDTPTDPDQPANQAYANRLSQNRAATQNPGTPNYDQKFEQKKAEVTQQVIQPLRQEFFGLMKNFAQQATQKNLATNGRYASVSHHLIKNLYDKLMPIAAKILSPNMRRAKPGERPSHLDAYQAAKRGG